MKKSIFTFLFFFMYCMHMQLNTYQAVVIVPVADLVGQSLQALFPNQSIHKSYANLPLCGGTIKNELNCLRLHQLLFNEIIEVLHEKDAELCVRVPNLFYVTPQDPQPHDTYWMMKNAVIPLTPIDQHHLAIGTIPSPLSYKEKNSTRERQQLIALLEPWYDTSLRMLFSAGTQFVFHHYNQSNGLTYVWRYNRELQKNELIALPTAITLTIPHDASINTSIHTFLRILRHWIVNPTGAISYVLGGCSFTTRHQHSFKEYRQPYKGSTLSFYKRDYDTIPKNGFDCSGLISRAAQMAGIPYFFKNTLTLASYLEPIASNEILQEGDLIWIPGHVMIISSLSNNALIEARSYQHGYGIIHETTLNKVFKNIHTYADLLNAYHNKKNIIRIDKEGKERDTFADIKLLSLQSCWKKII